MKILKFKEYDCGCGCGNCGDNYKLNESISISESLKYHVDNNILLTENVFRYGSEEFFNVINEARELYLSGDLKLSEENEELIKTEIGQKAVFEGKEVWLDIPMEDEDIINEKKSKDKYKGKKSSKPMRDTSGGKAYKVYVPGCSKKTDSNPRGIKVVRFGSGGLKAKINDADAKKRYDSRHGCSKGKHNDKCKAGYWSCRLPSFAKALNLNGGGRWW